MRRYPPYPPSKKCCSAAGVAVGAAATAVGFAATATVADSAAAVVAAGAVAGLDVVADGAEHCDCVAADCADSAAAASSSADPAD